MLPSSEELKIEILFFKNSVIARTKLKEPTPMREVKKKQLFTERKVKEVLACCHLNLQLHLNVVNSWGLLPTIFVRYVRTYNMPCMIILTLKNPVISAIDLSTRKSHLQ
jgi:hypothetical protein